MKEQIILLVTELKKQVLQNKLNLNQKENEIRGLLNKPATRERSHALTEVYSSIKTIQNQNKNTLNIQLKLIKYLYQQYQYEYIPYPEQQKNIKLTLNTNKQPGQTDQLQLTVNKIITYQNILNQTLLGELTFDSNHPLFNHPRFYEDLYNGYSKLEKYEMCALIQKMKGEYITNQ